jgi:hypothetical protein
MNRKLILLLLIAALSATCKKKYPEDSWPHTNGPLKRLTRVTWYFYNYEFLQPNSYQFDSRWQEGHVTFNKDGTCETNTGPASNLPASMKYLFNFQGTWEFIEDSDKIRMTYPNYTKVWTVLRLERNSLTIACDSIKYSLGSKPKYK